MRKMERFLDWLRFGSVPKPQTKQDHLVVVRYQPPNQKHAIRRIMTGRLCKDIDIDISAFTLDQLENIIKSEFLPMFPKNHNLKVYCGGHHIRIWRNPKFSGKEDLLLIADSVIYDDPKQ